MKVVLVAIAKFEDYYLQEWIDYNLKLGFDHIVMYQNDWTCKLEHPQLTKLVLNGNSAQLPAYNHFLKNYSNEYDWGAFIDCDEFIVLKKHNNIKELIEEYNNPNGISLNWKFFGHMNIKERTGDSLVKLFTKSQIGTDRHIKTIVNFHNKGHRYVNPHYTNNQSKNVNGEMISGPFNYNGKDDVAYIAHYYHKTYEDWKLRIVRGRVDCKLKNDPDLWDKDTNNYMDVDNFDVLNFLNNKQDDKKE